MASTTYMRDYPQSAGGMFMPLASLAVETTSAVLDGLRTVSVNPLNAVLGFMAKRESRRQLAQLDDRLLEDIGLDRDQAIHEAKKVW